MKVKALVALAISAMSTGSLANNRPMPPFPMQLPLVFFNSTHHIVKFSINDDQGDQTSCSKLPIPGLPTILFNRVKPMWHHNIQVEATEYHLFEPVKTVPCEPFSGNFSYLSGMNFAALTDNNGQFICHAVHL